MAKRHGIKIDDKGDILFLLGILSVFDPWTEGKILWEQGIELRHPEKRPLSIKFHLRRVAKRLIISLTKLFFLMQDYKKNLQGTGPEVGHYVDYWEVQEEIGIAADSIFHYLNLLVDDIAKIIPFIALEQGVPEDFFDSSHGSIFNFVNSKFKTEEVFRNNAELSTLFSRLNSTEISWWSLAFKKESGLRQRLVHYTDLLMLHIDIDNNTRKPRIIHSEVGKAVRDQDVERALRELFDSLCEWLDVLEIELSHILSAQLKKKNVNWSSLNSPAQGFLVPQLPDRSFDSNSFFVPLISDVS